MTYDEILQYISGLQGSPVDIRSAMTGNPNDVNPGSGMGGLGQNIAWGNVPGLEQFYRYDGQNNQENFDIQSALPVMDQMGYQVMQANDPGRETMANWIVGPDGKPIAQSARLTGTNDDNFKLAALAAMGITGANVLGAGFGAGGAAQSTGTTGGGMGSFNQFIDPTVLKTSSELGLGAFNPADFAIMEAASVPSFADVGIKTLGNMAAQNAGSSALETMGPELGNGLLGALAPVAGAIGGYQPSGGETTTSQSKMDPQMEAMVYGKYFPQLEEFFNKNKNPNANQQAGWNKSLGLLNDPALSQQLGAMRNNAAGMLGNPVAANPFTSGQASLQAQPWQAMPRRGLFGG